METFNESDFINEISNYSKEELEDLLNHYEHLKTIKSGQEQSIKLLINSVYGAFGSPYFLMYNIDIAEAITMQGKDIIKSAEKYFNHYVQNLWPKDYNLHKKLNVKHDIIPIDKDINVYIDTDSCFFNFKEIMLSCNFIGNECEFILDMYKYRLKEYFQKCYNKYAEKFQTKSYQEFELELISDAVIFLAKKKYVLNPIWKDPGIYIESLSKIKPKGVELVQGSTPPWVRQKLLEYLKFIIKTKGKFEYSEIIKKLRLSKTEFELQPVEMISKTSSIGDYDKWIINDHDTSKSFQIASGCPIHIRAAGKYNYLLHLNKKLKTKYELIKVKDKVKYYYSLDGDNQVFGYPSDSYPYEFAPKVNYDLQFEKTVIEPLNRFMKVLNFANIESSLVIINALF